MLIALHSANPRCGKDTAADMLVNEMGFYKDSFGAEIYNEVAPAFGVTIEQLQSNEWKTQPQPELALINCRDGTFKAVASQEILEADQEEPCSIWYEPRTSRFLLQRWATEYRRAQDLRYWVNKVEYRLERVNDGVDIVISDLREMHEYNALRNFALLSGMSFRVLEIRRDGSVSNGHSSDGGIPPTCINTVIQNNDSIEEYLSAIRRTINNIRRVA